MKKIMATLCALLLVFTFTCEIHKSNIGNSITASAEFIDYRGYIGDATKEQVDFAIKTIDDFIAGSITSDMTEMQKAVTACEWITENYPYSRDYGGGDWVQVINAGGGICWGYSDLVDVVFKKMGIKCNTRIAGKDNPDRPSSHSNNAALIDGAYYKVDCSFNGDNIESLPTYDGWEYKVDQKAKTVTLTQYVGFDTDVVIKPYYDGYKTVSVNGATGYCKGEQIESFTFPDTVEFIGNQVLGGLPNLKTVKFGKGLKVIEGVLFSLGTHDSNNVTEIDLPEGLEYIGECAFEGLNKLKSVTIPESVTSIGGRAFADCKSLTNVTIPSAVTRVGSKIFSGCTSLKNVTLKCTKLQGIGTLLSDPVHPYSGGCFAGCSALESIDVSMLKSDNIEDLLAYWVAGCNNLTNIKLPSGLTKIPNGFYSGVITDEKKVEWQSTMKSIGKSSFAGCRFESFVIPNTIESIEAGAFEYCKNLKILTVPSSVKSIGTEAFNECSSLVIHVPDSVTDFGDDCFTYVKTVIAQSKDSPVYKYCIANGFEEIVETEDEFKETCVHYEYDTAKGMVVPIKEKHCIWEEKIITPATCTEKGLKKKCCYWCRHWFDEDIPATGHTYSSQWSIDKAATCNSTGLKSHHCLNCQAKKDVTVIPKSNHSYDNGKVTKKPTCTTAGVKTFTCSCGNSYTETIKATGHKFGSWTTTKAATCTTDGTKTRKCSSCGKSDTQIIAKTGHTFDNGKVTKQPTETTTGIKTYTCTVCKAIKTETIPKLTHTHSYTSSVTKQPTCTATGIRTYTCSCGNSYTETIKATGHKYKTTVVKPTCTEKGYTLHKCSVCGDSYKDTYTNAAGHKFGNWTITKAATCTTEGTKTRKCSSCGKSETQTIAKTGHKYTTTVVEPTYSEQGYTLHKCTVCGDSYKDTIIAAKKVPVISGAKAVRTTYNSIKLSWDQTSDVDGYIVYRYNSERKSWIRLTKIADSDTASYTATGLASAEQYQIAVKGYVTENGKEVGSPKLSVVKAATNPGVVANFKTSANASNSVKLTWNKVNGAEGYVVYRYNPSNKGWIRLTKTKGTSYTATGLAGGTSYKFAVKSYITLNGKEFGGSQLTQVFTSANPDKVNFTVKSPSAGKATFNWSKVRGATGYIVYYKANAKDSWHRLTVTNGTSYTKTGLKRNNTYTFTVKAYRTTGGKVYNGKFINKTVKIK